MRLRNMVAVITGGANGIGGAGSEIFAKNGAKVVVLDINETAGKLMEQNLKAKGKEAIFIRQIFPMKNR